MKIDGKRVAIIAGCVLIGTITGGVFGISRHSVSAVASVKVGKVHSRGTPIEPVENIETISAFLESPKTIASIAESVKSSSTTADLETALMSSRFGGANNLTVRYQPASELVQIRVSAKSPATAVAAADAAASLLVEEQTRKITERRNGLKESLDRGRAEYAGATALYGRMIHSLSRSDESKDKDLSSFRRSSCRPYGAILRIHCTISGNTWRRRKMIIRLQSSKIRKSRSPRPSSFQCWRLPRVWRRSVG